MKKHCYIIGIFILLWIPLTAQNCYKRAKLDKKGRTGLGIEGMDGVQYLSAMGTVNFDAAYFNYGYFIESTNWQPLTQEFGLGLTVFPSNAYRIFFISTTSKFYLTNKSRKTNSYGNKGVYIGIRGYLAYNAEEGSPKLIYNISPELGLRRILYKKLFIDITCGRGYSNASHITYTGNTNSIPLLNWNVNFRLGLLTTK